MFATLRRKMTTFNLILNPLTLVLDFESGILPSLQHFPNSSIKGCNFHFTQAVWCKVVTRFSSSLQDRHPKENHQIIKSLISPPQFTQLFTLHIIYMGFFIPVVYAPLKDKSSDTYYQMFATLRRKMATFNLILNSLTLVLDFESGKLPSLRQHFPNSSIKGCNLHFTQAVWCKVITTRQAPQEKSSNR